MKSFKQHMNEDLKTKEIDPREFPNPVTDQLRKIFTKKGKMDGVLEDDVVAVKEL